MDRDNLFGFAKIFFDYDYHEINSPTTQCRQSTLTDKVIDLYE